MGGDDGWSQVEEVRDLHQLSIGILGGDHLGLGHTLPDREGDSGRVRKSWGRARLSPMTGQESCWHRGEGEEVPLLSSYSN